MAKQSFEEKEAELQQRLAPHVEGELVAAVPVFAGGWLVRGLRTPPAGVLLRVLAAPVAKMRNEETGIPLHAVLALTAEDVYVFNQLPRSGDPHAPLRHWRIASLQSAEAKKSAGRALRVSLRLESGKKAIFWGSASDGAKDRVHTVLEGNGAGPPSADA